MGATVGFQLDSANPSNAPSAIPMGCSVARPHTAPVTQTTTIQSWPTDHTKFQPAKADNKVVARLAFDESSLAEFEQDLKSQQLKEEQNRRRLESEERKRQERLKVEDEQRQRDYEEFERQERIENEKLRRQLESGTIKENMLILDATDDNDAPSAPQDRPAKPVVRASLSVAASAGPRSHSVLAVSVKSEDIT
eukprot:NODE_974_length_1064_cov_162.851232_g803_i0.p1 GENE.NODE_974_length_1064_cov_162.851232_g803_i0~~NODE_974_length_1064_cov_162.851232_g803_i0.p1  ORF type:complete len:205 (-),score=42.31 NODE_974_length_1064_cov_162.851232_g803_i0:448-1029(-)